MKDKCCGEETPFETHIDFRNVEGVGQTCPRGCVHVSYKTILETPNDYELGELIRKTFYNERNDLLQ